MVCLSFHALPASATARRGGSMAGAGRLLQMVLVVSLSISGLPQMMFASDRPLTLRTPSALIIYHRSQDLVEMDRRLDFRLDALVNQESRKENRPLPGQRQEIVAAKLEALLARVSQLLYLAPPGQCRLHIRLLADGLAVRSHYVMHHARNSALAYHPLEAYYEASSRTIYLSLADLRPGILAHELAHYLFCTALPGPPPRPVQEEWARYAESHLGR
jgi:hypothetical protein